MGKEKRDLVGLFDDLLDIIFVKAALKSTQRFLFWIGCIAEVVAGSELHMISSQSCHGLQNSSAGPLTATGLATKFSGDPIIHFQIYSSL